MQWSHAVILSLQGPISVYATIIMSYACAYVMRNPSVKPGVNLIKLQLFYKLDQFINISNICGIRWKDEKI